MKHALLATLFVAAFGCAPPDDVDAVSFATPAALIEDCANPPELSARLWISGSKVPCELAVDAAAGTTSGECTAAPGVVRTVTLDWFTPSNGIDLVLAQARGEVDLTTTANATASFAVAAEDVSIAECRDMIADQVEGSPTITLGGVDVPVCDVDESCGDTPEDGCSNLGELCSGSDPFDAGDEP